jgi:predicted aldo/keto reductase-like oxidoreductase
MAAKIAHEVTEIPSASFALDGRATDPPLGWRASCDAGSTHGERKAAPIPGDAMSDHDPHDSSSLPRRDFLKLGSAAAAGLVAREWLPGPHAATPGLPSNPKTNDAMPTRNLGKTGYRPGIFSLGGQAAVEKPDNEAMAVSIVERAIDLGVNYVDTAAAYGGTQRWSQRYIGQVMARRRNEVFLTSKTHDRTKDGSLRLLEESLRLLNTDHLDLWQLHNVMRLEQIEQIFAPGGAIEALQQAREQKMVRFLGITGHFDPEPLMEGIRRFPFDTVLMALNAADRHKASFAERLLPMAVEKQMGIIGMKIPARSRILASFSPPPADSTPMFERMGGAAMAGAITIREAMYYTLTHPVSTVIIGCDNPAQVEENVRLAREFTPLSDSQLADLAVRTQPIARQALFFRRWA